MRNTIIRITVLCLAAGFLVSYVFSEEVSDDLETYVWLEREAIADETVPNSKIHSLISQGLSHDNPEIVHCVVSALALHIGSGRDARIDGIAIEFDRKLQDIPDLYDTLIGIWDKGIKESGGVLPDKALPDDLMERMVSKTGCVGAYPTWIMLPLPLSYLFPGDDKVYEIIWKAFPEPSGGFKGDYPSGDPNDPYDPGALIAALHEGKFNNPKDQKLRVKLLSDRNTRRPLSAKIARGLGEFQSESGLKALVSALREDNMEYGTPIIPIIESLIKYDEKAKAHISLMRKKLEEALPLNALERDLKLTLQERLIQFEEKYTEE